MAYRTSLDFLLFDWLQAERLNARPRFADHSRETFAAVLDTCERIAREKFAPFNRTVDREEPRTEVDADGALLLEANGRVQRFVSGEASLRVIEGDT